MGPIIFPTAAASAGVVAFFGPNPVRLYDFDEARQNTPKPYAVYRDVTGSPENYLGNLPDMDRYLTQIDVFADTKAAARQGAELLRDALEPTMYVTNWRGGQRDPDTNNFRYSFDVESYTPR